MTVDDRWQRTGIGTRLLECMIREAGRRGVERLYGDVLRDNLPMIEFARRLGFAFGRHPSNPTLLRIERVLHAVEEASAVRAFQLKPAWLSLQPWRNLMRRPWCAPRTETTDAMTPALFEPGSRRCCWPPAPLRALASAMYLTVRPAMDARSMASASPPGRIGVEVAGRVRLTAWRPRVTARRAEPIDPPELQRSTRIMQFTRQMSAAAVLAAAAFATAGAHAAGADEVPGDVAPMSRAQVRSDTLAAMAAGQIPRGEATPDDRSRIVSARTAARSARRPRRHSPPGRSARRSCTRLPEADRLVDHARGGAGETIAAMRLGLIPAGELVRRQATVAEREALRTAGLRAARAVRAGRKPLTEAVPPGQACCRCNGVRQGGNDHATAAR